jgi:sugar lactone lactonase YvrE
VALSSDATLYVADSLNNRIAAISSALERMSSAGTGRTVSTGGALNDPLGLTISGQDGNIITTNGNDGFMVTTSPDGQQISKVLLDNTGTPPGAGTLFGLAGGPSGGVYFVDDGSNTLNHFVSMQ